MNILVIGSPDSQAEFNSKFGSRHTVEFKSPAEINDGHVKSAQVIFDFEISTGSPHGQFYHSNPQAVLFLNSVISGLLLLVDRFQWGNPVIGFNGMPGMFDKPLLELTTLLDTDLTITEICQQLGTDFRLVKDRVGMVTPRVVCMIINEAFFTVAEGTALEADIDLAMKLGTNYPAGPFEMAATIGIQKVCQLLDSLLNETGDQRYRVCPLLRKKSREI